MCGTGAEVALVPRCGRSCVIVVVVAVVSRRERRVACMSIPRHALMRDVGPLLSSRDRGRGCCWHPQLVVVTTHSRDCDRWSLVTCISPRYGVARFCAMLGCWSWRGQRRGVQPAPPVHHVATRDCGHCGGGWCVWQASAVPALRASVRRQSVARQRQRWWGVQRLPLLVIRRCAIVDAIVGRWSCMRHWLWHTSGDPVSRASARRWGVA